MRANINEALRLCRVYSDMSAIQFKEVIGYSSGFISEIESGKKTPTTQMISKYAEWLGVSVSSLIVFSESLTDNGLQNLHLFLEMKRGDKNGNKNN